MVAPTSKAKTDYINIMTVMGISSGRTSVMMLMESVLALEVGAAARRIFSSAIMYCGSDACKHTRNKYV